MTSDDEDDDGHAHCSLCGAISERFVFLIEYAVGFRDHDTMVRTGPLEDDEDGRAGRFVCFPGCLIPWFEGKLIEAEVSLRNVDS